MFLGLVLAPHLCPHTQNTMAFFGSNATREKAGKEEKKKTKHQGNTCALTRFNSLLSHLDCINITEHSGNT